MNADLIEPAINKNTKAIIPVHLYGQLCNMKSIKKIADRHNLKIIEDAAHAIEASRDGIKVGQLAHTACFSFYATKSITSAEGGAVSTNRKGVASMLRMLRLHGIDKDAAERYTKEYKHWDMPLLGWKYNMDNLQAALLIGQLKRIEHLWNKRNNIWMRYEEAFRDIKDISLLKSVPHSKHARHLFTILVPKTKRDYMLWSLQRHGIGIAVNYRPIHLLRYYKKTFGYKINDYPVAEEIGQRTISLPLYPSLTKKESQYIVKIVREEMNK
jgi:dTDP-4-amino-4,6-dideoxygalactose transaminase